METGGRTRRILFGLESRANEFRARALVVTRRRAALGVPARVHRLAPGALPATRHSEAATLKDLLQEPLEADQ